MADFETSIIVVLGSASLLFVTIGIVTEHPIFRRVYLGPIARIRIARVDFKQEKIPFNAWALICHR
jgi:hypothetical protein